MGTGIVQLLTLASVPVLTRLFDPEAFGQAATFAAITSILAIIACMSYEYAIVSPKSDKQASNLLALSLGICTIFVVVIVIPLAIFGGSQILQALGIDVATPLLWLIPIMVWLIAAYQALNYWNTRTKHFTQLSIARLTGAVTGTGGALGFGISGFSTGSHFVIAQIGGQAVSTLVLGGTILRANGRFILGSLSLRRVKALLCHYKNFPGYYTLSNLTNNVASQLPILLISFFFTGGAVGFYSVALRILQAPMGLIGASISQVFHERAAAAKHTGNLKSVTLGSFEKLVRLGLFPILLIGAFAPDIFSFLLGKGWNQAGVYAALLTPYIAVRFISSPLSVLSAVLEKQEKAFWFSFIWLGSGFLSFLIGAYFNSVELAIRIYALNSGTLFFLRIFLYHSWAGISVAETCKPLFRPIIGATSVFILQLSMKTRFTDELIYLLLFLILLVFWFFYVTRHFLWKETFGLLKKL